MKYIVLTIMLIGAALQLAGCSSLGYQQMSPEQIRATAGTSSCVQYTGLYGKASMIALNADDVRKGVNSTGDLAITCGDATMSIKSSTAVPAKP